MIIAERKFILDASQQRIWALLLKSVLRFMPFERLQPLSEQSVSALLRVKVGFISLPMNVEIEIVEAVQPRRLTTLLKARGMGGLVWLRQRAEFTLTPIPGSKTEVSCKIAAEGMSLAVRLFLSRRVKGFAGESFEGLEKRLREWI